LLKLKGLIISSEALSKFFIFLFIYSIDKKLKNFNFQSKKILKYFINLRMLILDFLSNLEFHIFYTVIDQKINKLSKKISELKSIDHLINSHFKFVREIHFCLGIKDEKFSKTLFKIINLILNYGMLLSKYILIEQSNYDDNNNRAEKLESIYIDVFNFTERFKKKKTKFMEMLEIYREKAKN
jgi:hypothetical protein